MATATLPTTNARAWLEHLAKLSIEDLGRVSQLVDKLITADRATALTAEIMLDAAPAPTGIQDGRVRLESIISYLEARS